MNQPYQWKDNYFYILSKFQKINKTVSDASIKPILSICKDGWVSTSTRTPTTGSYHHQGVYAEICTIHPNQILIVQRYTNQVLSYEDKLIFSYKNKNPLQNNFNKQTIQYVQHELFLKKMINPDFIIHTNALAQIQQYKEKIAELENQDKKKKEQIEELNQQLNSLKEVVLQKDKNEEKHFKQKETLEEKLSKAHEEIIKLKENGESNIQQKENPEQSSFQSLYNQQIIKKISKVCQNRLDSMEKEKGQIYEMSMLLNNLSNSSDQSFDFSSFMNQFNPQINN